MIKKILNLVEKEDKKKLVFIVILSLFTAFFEVLGIGSLIPLIEFFSNEDVLGFKNLLSSTLYEFGINEDKTSEIKKNNLEVKNFFSKLGIFLIG